MPPNSRTHFSAKTPCLKAEAVSSRDLIRTARAIAGKHDSAGLFRFGGVLRGVGIDRSLGCDQTITRIELESAVILAATDLAERLADAPEPFWRHVRDALRAHREAEEAYWESVEDAGP